MGTDARLVQQPLIKNLIVKKLYKYIYVFIKLITRFNHVYNFFLHSQSLVQFLAIEKAF